MMHVLGNRVIVFCGFDIVHHILKLGFRISVKIEPFHQKTNTIASNFCPYVFMGMPCSENVSYLLFSA